MKSRLIVAAIAVMALVGNGTKAQTTATTTPKIGWTNVDVVLNLLPDSKRISNELQIYRQQLEKVLQDKNKELQEKYQAYQKNEASWSEIIKADKAKEIENGQQSIQELTKNSEQDLQMKYQKLVAPVMTKIDEAIKAVGKENGYTYILNQDAGNNSTPIVLFSSVEENNVTGLVLKKLGVDPAVLTAKPAAPTTAPATTTPATKPATTPPTTGAAPKKN